MDQNYVPVPGDIIFFDWGMMGVSTMQELW